MRISRFTMYTATLVVAAAVLTACTSRSKPVPAQHVESVRTAIAYPLQLNVGTGPSVTIESRPKRIVALFDVTVRTLDAIDADSQIVAIDDFSKAPDHAPHVPRVGGDGFKFSVEKIVGLHPDLVITSTGTEDVLDHQLEAAGIQVVALAYPTSVDETLANIRTLGDIAGHRGAATELASDVSGQLDAIASTVASSHEQPVTVYYEGDASTPGKPYSVGQGSLIDELIGRAGGANVLASATTPAFQTSYEAIVAAKPTVIVLGDAKGYVEPQFHAPVTIASVSRRPGFSTIPAVRTRRVSSVHGDSLLVPGPHLAEGLLELVAALHPDLAADAAHAADLPAPRTSVPVNVTIN
ncbi:MAG: periplasmic binding protein [Thermoleophilia bacterium]|nr:periplasmic binding protein [Thermoleophilia bacterium]